MDIPFENRIEAAKLLGRRLAEYRGQRPLILAIPRGAVPMGKVVADALEGELDVVLVRKLRAPQNPELAIGSIDEVGTVYLDPHLRDLWTDVYLKARRRGNCKPCDNGAKPTDGQARPLMPAGAWSSCWTTALPPDRR